MFMIKEEEIKRLSIRAQTNPQIIAREYAQHNCLSELYRLKGSENLLFKGGTALRIIYQSPRFSEDLDFTGINGISYLEIENILTNTLKNLSDWGFNIEIDEAKKTTGGYLAKTVLSFLTFKILLKMEISFRQNRQKVVKEISSIANEYIPNYDIIHLPQEEIINGKISALLDRSKPRDWYDLYFFLRQGMLTPKQKKILPKILSELEKIKMDFKKELKEFLPYSHQIIIKDFRNTLSKEIKKNY